jgi:hypothetical protein
LRGKNKSLLEDALIFLVIGVLIYLAYSFFFSSNEEIIIEENNTNIIENKIENNPIEPIKKEEITLPKVEEKTIENRTIENKIETLPEPIKKEEMVTPKILEKSVEVQKSNDEKIVNTSINTTNIVEKKVEIKEVEKPITSDQPSKELDDKAKVDAFYKTIKDKIYFNIEKNIDKTQIKKGEFVNIRLTIFKDGRFEQLTLIEGNNQNFELIKSSISQAFPVVIDDSLKANFPRYFRMKIEF